MIRDKCEFLAPGKLARLGNMFGAWQLISDVQTKTVPPTPKLCSTTRATRHPVYASLTKLAMEPPSLLQSWYRGRLRFLLLLSFLFSGTSIVSLVDALSTRITPTTTTTITTTSSRLFASSMFSHRLFGPIVRSNRCFLSTAPRRRTLCTLLSSNSNMETPPPPPFPTTKIPTNAELVERRLQVARDKEESRQRSIQQKVERNLRVKEMIQSSTNNDVDNNTKNKTTALNGNGSSSYQVPPLFAVKVSVDEVLREELRLNGREKRGRVFLEQDSNATQTLFGLRQELHSFFRCLKKSTFVLSASLPRIQENQQDDKSTISILHPVTIDGRVDVDQYWPVATDEQVEDTFARALEFFESSIHNRNNSLQRPCIMIHVSKDPNAPPPITFPYLDCMEDPLKTTHMTMLSFYAFPTGGIRDPEDFAALLRRRWKPFGALGRIYVATEGVNAQMSVPTNCLDHFVDCCMNYIPELGVHMENGINLDPMPLSVEEFKIAGTPVRGQPAPPFRGLHVRVRNQIVSDGLDHDLDWTSAGYDMPPLEWHAKLKEARDARELLSKNMKEDDDRQQAPVASDGDDDLPILLDCRNTYETNVGIFDGAELLGTENFRDSWEVLEDRLKDTPKDSPIMTYCTGGIRCVKVGAYLTQEMGFTNVSRLAGGIIAYDRTLNEKAVQEEPMFKGTNFVFDGRLGRAITEDDLGECVTCGAETSSVRNCLNDNCHKRMIQCDNCKTSFSGTCSDACKQRVLRNQEMIPRQQQKERVETSAVSSATETKYETIEEYSSGHSTPPPSFYREIEYNTQAQLPSGSHMVSGASQGRWLTHLASTTREGRILELGTFIGYATACFLEGAANAGDVLGTTGGTREGGSFVMTLERDQRAIDIAVAHFKIMTEFGVGEEAAEAACALRSGEIPAVEGNAVSLPAYKGIAGCEVIRVTDALATMEEMAAGAGDLLPSPFDIVFVDADKTRMLEYVEACVSSDRVLKRGGLIIVDNVLWKGLVLEASTGEYTSSREEESGSLGDREWKKTRRARKLASKMHFFNSEIVKDDRVEVVVLPMRDGLSIIRKK